MTKDECKIGMVVYMTSGSPPLTITKVWSNGGVDVMWFYKENIHGLPSMKSTTIPCLCLAKENPRKDARE